MGPDNPWSPNWRPDPTGGRLIAIRAARRGALLAGVLYLPVGALALGISPWPGQLALLALMVGLPGVALLGASLGSSTLGSRRDAVIAGTAFALGAPVASVASSVIGALVVGALVGTERDLAGPILRAGVSTAVAVAPLVVLAAAAWTAGTRRSALDRVASGQRSARR